MPRLCFKKLTPNNVPYPYLIEFEDDLIDLDETPVTPIPSPSPIPPTPTPPPPPKIEPIPIVETHAEPPEPENNLRKAIESACGKVDDQNRITSGKVKLYKIIQ